MYGFHRVDASRLSWAPLSAREGLPHVLLRRLIGHASRQETMTNLPRRFVPGITRGRLVVTEPWARPCSTSSGRYQIGNAWGILPSPGIAAAALFGGGAKRCAAARARRVREIRMNRDRGGDWT
ncbi:hypothetical protein SC1_00760 [Sphingopyxis sp. C-1]|nr:hypothetical protein SC1_00760 [Sphingopyxis sp. C-1]